MVCQFWLPIIASLGEVSLFLRPSRWPIFCRELPYGRLQLQTRPRSSNRIKTPKTPKMAKLDSQVASVLDRKAVDSDDEDALIASLEDSPAMDAFREQRIQQLHAEFTRAKSQKNQGFGNYTEIKEEKALMDLTTEVKYAIVHFSKDDFARCGVMDGHLEV